MGAARQGWAFAPPKGVRVASWVRLASEDWGEPTDGAAASWPTAPFHASSLRVFAALAGPASALAFTGRGRAPVRLWLITRVAQRAARSCAAATAAPTGAVFESAQLDRLQSAARDLQSVQAELTAVAEALLPARAKLGARAGRA